jgi:hypothetical protein
VLKSLVRTRLLLGFLVALGILSAVVWFFLGDAVPERMRRERFDPVTWQGQKSFTKTVRIRMVDDLLHHQSYHGMTRVQLTAIVGEPDTTEYFKDWDLVYWLGPERGFFGIDSEWLVFQLDNQQRVTDYRIVTD